MAQPHIASTVIYIFTNLMLTYETYANVSALVPRHKAKAQLNEAKKLLVAENDASLGGIEIRELICEVLRMCFRLFTVGAASSLTIACMTTRQP